jgi:hypothetical protein
MAPLSIFETLPIEITNSILYCLLYPRSRLPGRTEWESDCNCPMPVRKAARRGYYSSNHTALPDTGRFAEDLFAWDPHGRRLSRDLYPFNNCHPFNTLALTSRRMKEVVEEFCKHLVKINNRFNIPFALLEEDGPSSMYPALTSIVWRRLLLQYAPRCCVFCGIMISYYPMQKAKWEPILTCLDCYYAQVYVSVHRDRVHSTGMTLTCQTLREVEEQFHISRPELTAHRVRGRGDWVLRIDIELLALQLYGTRVFHNVQGGPNLCPICSQFGRLQQLVQLHHERHAESWGILPNTDGWVVTRIHAGAPEQDDVPMQNAETEVNHDTAHPRQISNWPQYWRYRQNIYLYDDNESHCVYNLRFLSLET